MNEKVNFDKLRHVFNRDRHRIRKDLALGSGWSPAEQNPVRYINRVQNTILLSTTLPLLWKIIASFE